MLGGWEEKKKKKGKARPVEICSRLGKNQGVFLVLELGLEDSLAGQIWRMSSLGRMAG